MGGKTLNYVLFFVTIFTTLYCGMALFGGSFFSGVLFSATVMAVLLVHEFGHYFNARRHGVSVTLPYFIPLPFGIGTMGAFIRMKSAIPDRNVLMDVGAGGPLWGFIASVLAVAVGMDMAQVADKSVSPIGSSLLYSVMAYLVKGVSPEFLEMNPVLFAGWLGLFVTMLNLLPIGQLDGGHVVYALFGKSRHYAKGVRTFFLLLCLWGIICLSVYNSSTWLFFGILVYFMGGVVHPLLDNEMEDLTPQNRIKGWACALIFVLTFLPAPFMGR